MTSGDPGSSGDERFDIALARYLGGPPPGSGYWMVGADGSVYAFGDARRFGDMSTSALNGPALDSITTPSGNGYYLVASDGGVFAFGDAVFAGSMGGRPLNAPVQSAGTPAVVSTAAEYPAHPDV